MPIKRWLQRIVIVVVIGFIALYAGDWALFHLRGSPTESVVVEQYQTVPLKGNKFEADYLGDGDISCSVSLFPQAGLSACWHLRRNPKQTTSY